MGLGAQIEVLNSFDLEKFTSNNTTNMCLSREDVNSNNDSATKAVTNHGLASSSVRSTKGASKQRRDLINAEIGNMRDILPLPESARQRLSQLQIMSLACCYIRKCNYFARLFGDTVYTSGTPFEFSQAMTGFLLITTREGKLLYISENVTEYLGHSMVDMLTQGDSLYDIIDKRDHSNVQGQLLQTSYNPCPDTGLDSRTFFCRMNVSRSFRRQAGFGDHKVMHVRGHFIQPLIRDHYGNQPVFMAICSPLITPEVKETVIQNSTLVFQSVHGLDMKYIEMAQNGTHHLGYSNTEVFGKSWYELLHPEDVVEAKDKHMQLIKSSHEMGCMLTARLLAKDGVWIWVNMVMHIRQPFICDNGDPAIVCINQIISDAEANLFKVQSQLESSHIARSPEVYNPTQGSSPPHTITQVPAERDQQMEMPFTVLLESNDPTYYEAQFSITTTAPSGGDSGNGVGSPHQGGSQLTGLQTQHASNPGGLSDSSSDGASSPKSLQGHKEILRAEILNRLQLKRSSAMANQQCKAAKRPRVSHGSNDHSNNGRGNGTSVSASVAIIPSFGGRSDNLRGQSAGGFSSGADVMGPVIGVPMFNDLSLKQKELLIPEPVMVHSTDFKQPLTPPTPESVCSDVSSPSSGMTKLRVDISKTAILPTSLLTPESSPVQKECGGLLSSQTEQMVPTIFEDVENAIHATELENETILKQEIKKEKTDLEILSGLPELDTFLIEDYFNAVEKKTCEIKTEIKIEPLSPPSSSVGSPAPVPSPASTIESAASPAPEPSSASQMDMSPAPQHVPSPAHSMASVPSPVSQQASPAAQPTPNNSDKGPQVLPSLSDAQLNNLVATVTEAILDMVKVGGSNQGAADVTGGFMLIPGGNSNAAGNNKTDELSVEVPDVEMVESPLSGDDSPLPDPIAEAALIDELHQLDQLANAAPSYGDAAGLDPIFDETL